MVPLGGSVCGSGATMPDPCAAMRIGSVPQAERLNRTRPSPSLTTRPPSGCLVSVRGCPELLSVGKASWPLTSRRLLPKDPTAPGLRSSA